MIALYYGFMKTWIALLKSINVGGHNILPMAELKALAKSVGYRNISTYIQSGNCVFQSDEVASNTLSTDFSEAINKVKGFEPPILVLSHEELKGIIADNPFDVSPAEGNKVHFHFSLNGDLTLDLSLVEKIIAPTERLKLRGKVLYLYAPDGVGRSKLFAKLPKVLSHDVTVRNFKTVLKLQEIANST